MSFFPPQSSSSRKKKDGGDLTNETEKKELRQRERERKGIFGKTRYGTLLYYFSTQPPTMAIKRIKKRKKHFNPSSPFAWQDDDQSDYLGVDRFPCQRSLVTIAIKEEEEGPPFSLSLRFQPTAFGARLQHQTGPDEG